MGVDGQTVGVVVGNIVLTVAAAFSGYTARRAHKSGKTLDRLTNGEIDKRIRTALREELASSQGDEIKSLLNAIIYHGLRENDE